jgi:uncharacterized repeat protein (TIGR01451 family)
MWYSKVFCWSKGTGESTTRRRPAVVRPRKFLPRLEALEGRLVPAVFNVTSLLDSNAAGSGALRRAITDSNATAGPNQIHILTPGVFRLTLNGDSDDNTTGDLDVLNNGVTIANESGGTVVIDAGSLTTPDRVIDVSPTGGIISVTITGVTIQGGKRTTRAGGGIAVANSSTLVLNNDIVQSNTTTEFGGGIFAFNSVVKLNATIVRHNTGSEGGGIGSSQSFSSSPGSDLSITDSLIADNTATDSGGGLLNSSNLTISSSTFTNNRADTGGGLFLIGAVDSTLTNVTISGNSARFGGGLTNESTGVGTLLNDTIAFNSATRTGGGVLSRTNRGGLTFVNTIVAKNTAVDGHPDVDNGINPADMFDFATNFIGDNTGAAGSFPAGTRNDNGSFVGTGAAPLDPLLEPLADNGGTVVLPDGGHLLTHQAKANSGNNGVRDRGRGSNFIPLGAPSKDGRGFPRSFNSPVDIGAFEFQDFDVAVSTSAPAATVQAGLPATFTLTVRNLGPNPARGVILTATLPAGTVVVAASSSFTVSGNVVTFAVPDLAAGGSTSFILTALPAASGPFTATAVLSGHDDPNPANNTASASVEVLPRPFPATGFADVTALVRVVRQGRRGPRKRLLFRITNVSGTPIQGPVGLVVAGLPRRREARLLNASGRSGDRQQFVRIDLGGDNLFDPGESAMVQLVFAQPFNPRRLHVLAGAFA